MRSLRILLIIYIALSCDILVAQKNSKNNENKKCDEYRNMERDVFKVRPEGKLRSIKELACMWVDSKNINVGQKKVSDYLKLHEDSICLGKGVKVYAAKTIPAGEGEGVIYFLQKNKENIYYKEVGKFKPNGKRYKEEAYLRSIRKIDVKGAKSEYIWFEIGKRAVSVEKPQTVTIRWSGDIFAYDDVRGMRHLHSAPVRVKKTRGGKLVGLEQWDVSVPKPGIILVERRIKKGKVGRRTVREGGVMLGPREWLGRHVIDTTVTRKREVRSPVKGRRIIDSSRVEEWKEEWQ